MIHGQDIYVGIHKIGHRMGIIKQIESLRIQLSSAWSSVVSSVGSRNINDNGYMTSTTPFTATQQNTK